MESKLLAIYSLSEIDDFVTTKAGTYPTIQEIHAYIVGLSSANILFDSTFYTTNKTMLDEVTNLAFTQLAEREIAEVDCDELDVSSYITEAPDIEDIATEGYLDEFVRHLCYFMESSTTYIERLAFYETYKSQFMTDTISTVDEHSGSDKTVRDTDTTRSSNYNNTPQESGDWSGEGYVNEVSTGEATDDTTITLTHGHKITKTKTDLITKRLAEADKAIKNIYIEWLKYFRNICLLD